MYASGGHISFNSERNMEKNAAKNRRFLDFPCPIPTTVQKGSASNRLYPYPRCRSHAPRGSALLRRGRRPRRPVARSFHASGGNISRSGATSFCPRRQKDAKTPPKTHGLWNSFTPNVIRRKKAHKESLPLLSPLPLPRTARVACYDRLRYSAIRAAAAPTPHAETRRSVIVQWDCCVHIGGFPNTGAPR